MEEKKDSYISMLLDVEHVYGQHSTRLGPILLSLCICASPVLVYVYFALWIYIPLWLFIPLEIIVIIRTLMIVQGREPYRVEIFRRRIHDKYETTASFMNIKTIHPDGCIEYINGTIMYMVVCFNGTTTDEIQRTIQLRKFLISLLGEYLFDIYIHNIADSPALFEYYKKAVAFNRNEAARNFVKIIDYSRDLTTDNSMVQATIFCVKGRRNEWKDIKKQVDIAINSRNAKVYKTVFRLNTSDAINEVLNRNIDSVVDIQKLLRNKYKTGDYSTSRVLAYDLSEDQEIIQGKSAVKSVLPEQTKQSFHVKYKED